MLKVIHGGDDADDANGGDDRDDDVHDDVAVSDDRQLRP